MDGPSVLNGPIAQCRCGRKVSIITTVHGFEMCIWCAAEIDANEKRIAAQAETPLEGE